MTNQTVSARRPVLVAIGAIMAVAGAITGFVPVRGAGEDCGSVFAPERYSPQTLGGAFVDVVCGGEREERMVWVWALIILGIVLLLWGLRKRTPKTTATNAMVSATAPAPTASKSAQMDDLIALKEAGTLNAEQFQAAKNRVLGKTTPESNQKAKLDGLHASGVLSDAEYLAAIEALNK